MKSRPFFKTHTHTQIYLHIPSLDKMVADLIHSWFRVWAYVCLSLSLSFTHSLWVAWLFVCVCGVANKICTEITSKIYFVCLCVKHKQNVTFCRLDFSFHSIAYGLLAGSFLSDTHSHSLRIHTSTSYKLIKRLPFRQYSFTILLPSKCFDHWQFQYILFLCAYYKIHIKANEISSGYHLFTFFRMTLVRRNKLS